MMTCSLSPNWMPACASNCAASSADKTSCWPSPEMRSGGPPPVADPSMGRPLPRSPRGESHRAGEAVAVGGVALADVGWNGGCRVHGDLVPGGPRDSARGEGRVDGSVDEDGRVLEGRGHRQPRSKQQISDGSVSKKC